VAILLCVRYAGARRSEIATIKIDHHLELETKGHRKGNIEYLPVVVMYPEIAEQLWTYFTDHRPIVSNTTDQGYLFLSHGVRDYGRPSPTRSSEKSSRDCDRHSVHAGASKRHPTPCGTPAPTNCKAASRLT